MAEKSQARANAAPSLDGEAEREELSARYLWNPQQVDAFFAQENIDDVLTGGDTLWGLADNLGTVRDLAAYDDINDETSVAGLKFLYQGL